MSERSIGRSIDDAMALVELLLARTNRGWNSCRLTFALARANEQPVAVATTVPTRLEECLLLSVGSGVVVVAFFVVGHFGA